MIIYFTIIKPIYTLPVGITAEQGSAGMLMLAD